MEWQTPKFNMQAPETINCDSADVKCDGGVLGHPRVYLRIGSSGWVECPYCDRRFVLSGEPERPESH